MKQPISKGKQAISTAMALLLAVGSGGLIVVPAAKASAQTVTLANPGFETDTGTNGIADGWRGFVPATATGDLQVVSSPVAEGAKAQKMTVSGMLYNEKTYVDQIVPIEPNAEYELTGSIDVESLQDSVAQLYVDYLDASGTTVVYGGPTDITVPTNGYFRFQNTKLAPANATQMRVMAILKAKADGAGGSMYIDNFAIRKTDGTLVNGDFEAYHGNNDVADSWRELNDPVSVPDVAVEPDPFGSGSQVQRISGTSIANTRYVHVYQMVAAQPNTAYSASMKLYAKELNNTKAQLYFDFYDKNGTWLSAKSKDVWLPTSGWTDVNLDAVSPEGCAFFKVYAILRGTGDNGSGTIYVDDLKAAPTQVTPPIPPEQPVTDIIPKMTGATAPLGEAFSTPSNSNIAYLAFDENTSSYWYPSSGAVGTLGYDFKTPAVVREYAVTPMYSSYLKRAPKNWTFEGFDGQQWVVLDTQANVSDWKDSTKKTFSIDNKYSYWQYRLNVTADNGDALLELAELGMNGYYDVPVTPAGLWHTDAGDGTVSLAWKPENGVTNYNVYQDGVKVQTIPSTATTATITALENNRVYSFTITAENAAGESPKTAPVLAMPYIAANVLQPKLTSSTAPLGTAIASYNPNIAYELFDKNSSSYWYPQANTGWAGYDLGTPTVLREYAIQPMYSSYLKRAPKDWTLEGFDGTNWVALDTRKDISNWSDSKFKYFAIDNSKAYSQYRLNVTANNGDSLLEFAEMQLIGSYQAPVTPQGLWNTNATDGAISLSWHGVNGVTAYNIYQDGQKVLTIPNTAPNTILKTTITGLTNNQVYRFSVSAENEAGESPRSADILAMPYNAEQVLIPKMTAAALPLGAADASENPNNAYLLFDRNSSSYWYPTKNTGQVSYDFKTPTVIREYTIQPMYSSYLKRAPKDWTFEGFDGSNWVVLDTETNITNWSDSTYKFFTIDNKQAYTKYRLNVTANNGDSLLEFAEMQLLGSYEAPVTPQGLWNTASGDGTVSLAWNGVNGVTAYNIYQDGVKVLTVPNTTATTTLNATVTGLTNNHVYGFTVTAENAVGESVQSDRVRAMPYVQANVLTPKMTSDTAPSGVAGASSNNQIAYQLFDANSSSYWYPATGTTGTVSYQFTAPVVLRQYTIQPMYSSYLKRAPKDWTLEGFDGTNWVTLDQQTNITTWSDSKFKLFALDNNTAYSQYRLNITANNGDSLLEFAEIQLVGSK